MFKADFVCVLQDTNGKPLRELNVKGDSKLTRSCRVALPIDSEYAFRFKNMSSGRRKINIAIDGSDIGTWILSEGSKKFPTDDIIERYQHIAKKFKAVSINHPDISDPTSTSNGNITVSVWDELPPPQPLSIIKTGGGIRTKNLYGGVLRGANATSYSSRARGSSADMTMSETSCFSAQSGPLLGANSMSHSLTEPVGTVEGSNSNQVFGTTHWYGEKGLPLTFMFTLVGISTSAKSEVGTQFCTECGVELADDSRFCHACGTKVKR